MYFKVILYRIAKTYSYLPEMHTSVKQWQDSSEGELF